MRAYSANESKHVPATSSYSSKPSFAMQAKLEVGQPNDRYEHEADAVADTVMRMPEQNFIQRKCAECEKEEKEKVQRKNITPVQSKSESSTAVNGVIANSI